MIFSKNNGIKILSCYHIFYKAASQGIPCCVAVNPSALDPRTLMGAGTVLRKAPPMYLHNLMLKYYCKLLLFNPDS